jgi:hypothetical protein
VAEGFAQASLELSKMSEYAAKNFHTMLATTDAPVEDIIRCLYVGTHRRFCRWHDELCLYVCMRT